MANNTTSSGAGNTGRALSAALGAARPFQPRGARQAQAASSRVVSRFTPDQSMQAGRPLASLAFADQRMVRYLNPSTRFGAMPMFATRHTRESQRLENTSWLFPTPWYLDELSWLAAERQQVGKSVAQRAQAGVRPMWTGWSAPSMTASEPIRGYPWSSLISHRQASLLPMISQLQKRSVSVVRSVATPHQEFLSVNQLVNAIGGNDKQRARVATILRRSTGATQPLKSAPSDLRAQTSLQGRVQSSVAGEVIGTGQSLSVSGGAQGRVQSSVPGEGQPRVPNSLHTSRNQVAEKVQHSDQRFGRGIPAQILLAESLTRDSGRIAPSAGPRLALPAGLGGLVGSVQQVAAMNRPLNANAIGQETSVLRNIAGEASPIGSGVKRGGLSTLAVQPPTALGHIAWSDRWLARFAGASETAMALFAPVMSVVHPEIAFPVSRPYVELGGQSASAATPVVGERDGSQRIAAAPVQADDEIVSDEIFATLSRAAVQSPRVETKLPSTRAQRPTALVDEVLMSSIAAPFAGVRSSLGASPVAPGLRGALGLTVEPSYDARVIASAQMAQSYVQGELGPSLLFDTSGIDSARPTAARFAGDPVAKRMGPMSFATRGGASVATRDRAIKYAEMSLVSPDSDTHSDSYSDLQRTAQLIEMASVARYLTDTTPWGSSVDMARYWTETAGQHVVSPQRVAVSTRPGDIAASAQRAAIDTHLTSADLSFDFVPPELAAAIQVYGLGSGAGAQAARLSVHGPHVLSQGVSELDQILVALVQSNQATGSTQFVPDRSWTSDGLPTPHSLGASRADVHGRRRTIGHDVAPRTRGASLWPDSVVRALRLDTDKGGTDKVERVYPNVLAALDLLAAQTVVDAGQVAAYGIPATRVVQTSRTEQVQEESLGVAEVQEVYAALSRAPSGRTLTPTARAARSLAMARARSEHPVSAASRAAVAWAAFPQVLHGQSPEDTDTQRETDDSKRASDRRAFMATRAGASLQSLVAPMREEHPAYEETVRAFMSAADRAPSAAPELVRTAPSAPQSATAGANRRSQIPPWFEETARQMFQSVGSSDEISLAEMTLIHTAPATQVAASPRNVSQPAAPRQPPGPTPESVPEDLDEIAEQCFSKLMEAMQIARWRNGDPWHS